MPDEETSTAHAEWDAGHLGCGELMLGLRKRLRAMPGQVLRLVAHDAGATEDVPAYCRMTGHRLLRTDPSAHAFWIEGRVR